MAEGLNFLTHALYGSFYSYLDTSTVASLYGVNKIICENVKNHINDSRKMKRKPYARSSYFENKYRTGYITYSVLTYDNSRIRIDSGEGPVWNISAEPFDLSSAPPIVAERIIARQGIIKDLYMLVTYDVYGAPGLYHYMSKQEALDICESFRWWHYRKTAHFK